MQLLFIPRIAKQWPNAIKFQWNIQSFFHSGDYVQIAQQLQLVCYYLVFFTTWYIYNWCRRRCHRRRRQSRSQWRQWQWQSDLLVQRLLVILDDHWAPPKNREPLEWSHLINRMVINFNATHLVCTYLFAILLASPLKRLHANIRKMHHLLCSLHLMDFTLKCTAFWMPLSH